MIRQGSQGTEVRLWQETLRAEGYNVAVDGAFGTGTLAATLDFQRKLGVTADGVVGPATLQAVQLKSPNAPILTLETATATEMGSSMVLWAVGGAALYFAWKHFKGRK